MSKMIMTLVLVPAALLSAAFVVGEAAPNEKTKTCCDLQLKCCKPQSACCVADARMGCCEKGQKCCAEKRDCCVAVQKCCHAGSACCDEGKSCCGKAATMAVSRLDVSIPAASCCAKSKTAACCEAASSREYALAEIPGVTPGCAQCGAK